MGFHCNAGWRRFGRVEPPRSHVKLQLRLDIWVVRTMVRTGSKAQGFKEILCVVLWFKMSGLAELIRLNSWKSFAIIHTISFCPALGKKLKETLMYLDYLVLNSKYHFLPQCGREFPSVLLTCEPDKMWAVDVNRKNIKAITSLNKQFGVGTLFSCGCTLRQWPDTKGWRCKSKQRKEEKCGLQNLCCPFEEACFQVSLLQRQQFGKLCIQR